MLGGRRGNPVFSVIKDFLRDIVAENGDICSWKLRLELRMLSIIASNDLLASMARLKSESLHCFILLYIKCVYVLPQAKKFTMNDSREVIKKHGGRI